MKKYNCTVHGRKMYRLRALIGKKVDGTPIYKSFYGDGIKEAEEKRDRYFATPKRSTDTLQKLAQYYTYEIMVNENLSHGSIELYERQFRQRLKPSDLAIKPVCDLTRQDIQGLFNRLSKAKIAPSAMDSFGKYMGKLFAWMSREGYCENLMDGITIPRKKPLQEEITTFTEEEIKKITAEPNRLQFLFVLAFSAGLRQGELLGLRYTDIRDGCVHVSRQVKDYYDITTKTRMMEIKETKTKSSHRTVPLPKSALTAFEDHKRKHKKEMMQYGYRTEYVFSTRTGNHIDPVNLRRAWKRHLIKCGIPHRKFHACRATYCTLLCRTGVPLETASKLMGHSDVTTTAKFYRLVSQDELQTAVDRLNGIFQSPSGYKLATSE